MLSLFISFIAGSLFTYIFFYLKLNSITNYQNNKLIETERLIAQKHSLAEIAIKEKEFGFLSKIKIEEEERKNKYINWENSSKIQQAELISKLKRSEKRESLLKQLEYQIEIKEKELDEKLYNITKMNKEEVKDQLIQSIIEDAKLEAERKIRFIEDETKNEIENRSKKLLETALQRISLPSLNPILISSVPIEHKEIKGKIIGKEGCNIRRFEELTGTSLLMDESPKSILISSFDPIRREVAQRMLRILIEDGKVFPERIDEIFQTSKIKVDEMILQKGQEGVKKAGVVNFHPELIKLLGKLHFRYSLGQNVLEHSIEVSHILGLMVDEIGGNGMIARRIGLLHDIGKAIDGMLGKSHAIIGMEWAKKLGEKEEVCNGIGCHHYEIEATTIEGSLCHFADAISASRLGARSDNFELQIKRMRELEDIAKEIQGVEKIFALQLGKELRVIIYPEIDTNEKLQEICKSIKEKVKKILGTAGRLKLTLSCEKKIYRDDLNMRRSICFCEPTTIKAGNVGTYRFIYTTAQNLPKGTKVRFDLQSNGREVDWQIPLTNSKESVNTIYLQLEDGNSNNAKEVEIPNSAIPHYEFTLPKQISQGESFAIVLGSKDEKGKKGIGNRAQTISQRRRQFLMFLDPTGKGRFGEPEIFTIDIQGNKLHNIRILTPSLVGKNKRFDIVVRFEDQFGNLTSDTEDDVLLELSHELLRENLNWKIFVPETGFISLPNLYFNEAGVFTIQLKNINKGEVWRSSPIRCSEQVSYILLWGLLHGESDKVDAVENIDSCLRYFRDDRALNFYAISPFEDQKETTNDDWKNCVHATLEFNEDDRFSTFVSTQWVGEPKKEGVKQILYLKDQKQLIRKKDAKGATLDKLYNSFSEKEMISIPSFTMSKGFNYDFANFNPSFERVVEIYNAWGSSEMASKKGNPVPIKGSPKKGGIEESLEGSIIDALNENCRFGFVAGGLDDRGIYSNLFDAEQTQYHPGLTAILATEHSKGSIADALFKRHCYATTGARIVIEFSIAQQNMGSELSSGEKPGLLINRHINLFVAGQDLIQTIEIVRNGQVFKILEPNGYSFQVEIDDMDSLEKIALQPKDSKYPFVYYYIRVTQKNGHIAWSSPIWIDITPKVPLVRKTRSEPKAIKKEIVKEIEATPLDVFEDDDEF